MAGQFETTHPGTKIVCNFAASGSLLQQIAQGAPVDVFAAADQKTMNQAQEKGLIVPASRKNFVSNSLVLIAPEIPSLALAGLKDLAKPEVKRVALGNPATVPAGRYTQEALIKAGLWEQLKPKFIYGGIGAPGAGLREPGRSGRGFVLLHRCRHRPGEGQIMADGGRGTQPILYPLALVAARERKPWPRAFWILS